MNKLVNSIWDKEELLQWKESTISSIYKKCDETNCNNCRSTLLSSTYKISPNVILSVLNLAVDEIIGGYQFQIKY